MRSFEIGHKQPAECCSAVVGKEGGNNKTRSDTRRSIVGDSQRKINGAKFQWEDEECKGKGRDKPLLALNKRSSIEVGLGEDRWIDRVKGGHWILIHLNYIYHRDSVENLNQNRAENHLVTKHGRSSGTSKRCNRDRWGHRGELKRLGGHLLNTNEFLNVKSTMSDFVESSHIRGSL